MTNAPLLSLLQTVVEGSATLAFALSGLLPAGSWSSGSRRVLALVTGYQLPPRSSGDVAK